MKRSAWRTQIKNAQRNNNFEHLRELNSEVFLSRVEFTAQRRVRSYAFPRDWTFEEGDVLIITTPLTQSEIDARQGEGGPWGWGGFTSRFISSIALHYENPQTHETA